MKYTIRILLIAMVSFVSQYAFSQSKVKAPTTNLVLPPPTDPGDGGGGGGGGPIPPNGGVQYWSNYPTYGPAGAEQILLWEGNNATQDNIAYFQFAPNEVRTISFPTGIFSGVNDEARSATFHSCQPGRVFVIYDSPGSATNDDYCTVTIKKYTSWNHPYVLNGFEQSYEDEYVKVSVHYVNGLDGKVSSIKSYTTN